jgi:hypothetical protein
VPQIQRQDQGAPSAQRQVRDNTTPNPVVLGQPRIQGLFESAPSRKSAVQVDSYPNLRISLAPALLGKPLGYPVDLSEFQRKYNVQLDLYPNTVLLGIVPPPTEDVRVTFTASFDLSTFEASADDVFFVAKADPTRFDS